MSINRLRSSMVEAQVAWDDLRHKDPVKPHVAYCQYTAIYPNSSVHVIITRREKLVPSMQSEGFDISCSVIWNFNEWNFPINPNSFRQLLEERTLGSRYHTFTDRDMFGVAYGRETALTMPWTEIVDDVTIAARDLVQLVDEAMATALLKCDVAIAIASTADDAFVHRLSKLLRSSISGKGSVEVSYLPDMTVIRAISHPNQPIQLASPLLQDLCKHLGNENDQPSISSLKYVAVRAAGRYFSFKPIELIGVQIDLQQLLADAHKATMRFLNAPMNQQTIKALIPHKNKNI